MLVLGIDPGLTRTAWALLSNDERSPIRPTLIHLGEVKTSRDQSTLRRCVDIVFPLTWAMRDWPRGIIVIIERGIINPKQSPVAGGDINLLIGMMVSAACHRNVPIQDIHFVLPQTWRTRILGAANLQCRLEHLEGIVDLAQKKVRNQDQRDAIAVAYYGLMKKKEGVL